MITLTDIVIKKDILDGPYCSSITTDLSVQATADHTVWRPVDLVRRVRHTYFFNHFTGSQFFLY